MHATFDLHILFATNYSDACFQTGRAIAQLADICRVNLTILHVTKVGGATASVRRELESFFAEGDHYDSCRRVLLESDDPPAALAAYGNRGAYDLIMSPASDRLGVHRMLVPSFRGRLLTSLGPALWTSGPSLTQHQFRRGLQNVAYLVDYDHAPRARARLVGAFADRFESRLHALDVIPPITDGTVCEVLDSQRPLTPAHADAHIRELFGERANLSVDVGLGSRRRELRQMIERCEADVLFVAQEQARRGLFFSGFSRDFDRLPCPIVCLGSAPRSVGRWTFEGADGDEPGTRALLGAETTAARRHHPAPMLHPSPATTS